MTALPFATTGQAGNILLLTELSIPAIRNAVGDRTEFITLVLDESSAIVDGKRVEIDWQDFKAEKIFQYGVAALAPGRYDCRAVVRNLDDGRAAVGSCVVEVARAFDRRTHDVPSASSRPRRGSPLSQYGPGRRARRSGGFLHLQGLSFPGRGIRSPDRRARTRRDLSFRRRFAAFGARNGMRRERSTCRLGSRTKEARNGSRSK